MVGIFEENVLQGPAKVVFKNANAGYEEGIYKNGLLDGMGIRYNGDIGKGHYIKSEEGHFELNELHGYGKRVYYDGSEFEGIFDSGIPVEEYDNGMSSPRG